MVHEMFRKAVKSLASGWPCTDTADETNPWWRRLSGDRVLVDPWSMDHSLRILAWVGVQ